MVEIHFARLVEIHLVRLVEIHLVIGHTKRLDEMHIFCVKIIWLPSKSFSKILKANLSAKFWSKSFSKVIWAEKERMSKFLTKGLTKNNFYAG